MIPDTELYLAFRLPRILNEAGFTVDLLCLRGDLVAYSKYVRQVETEESESTLFHRLTEVLRCPDRRWCGVIVAREKLARSLISTGDRAVLENWQPAMVDPLRKEFFLGKFALETVYNCASLPVPASKVCRTITEACHFGENVGWPILLKPADGSGGYGIVEFDSGEKLRARTDDIQFPMLAQKVVYGRKGVVDMVCSKSKALAWLTSLTTKKAGAKFAPSTARLFYSMPQLTPLVEQVARFTQFEGFCGFDWMEDQATGEFQLLEFHPRPPSGFRFGRYCGVDFGPAVAAWLENRTESFSPIFLKEGVRLSAPYFSSDLFRCLKDRDWDGLKEWLPGSRARHDVFIDDWPLFLRWARQRLWNRIQPRKSLKR